MAKNYKLTQIIKQFKVLLLSILITYSCSSDSEKLKEFGFFKVDNPTSFMKSDKYNKDSSFVIYYFKIENSEFLQENDSLFLRLGDQQYLVTGNFNDFNEIKLDTSLKVVQPEILIKRVGVYYGKFSKISFDIDKKHKYYSLNLCSDDLEVDKLLHDSEE